MQKITLTTFCAYLFIGAIAYHVGWMWLAEIVLGSDRIAVPIHVFLLGILPPILALVAAHGLGVWKRLATSWLKGFGIIALCIFLPIVCNSHLIFY